MGLMEERDSRFRNVERKAGLFLLVAAAFVALSVVLIGLQRDLFRVKHRVRVIADSALNLSVGQPVKYKGFRIGKLEHLVLDPDGQVVVLLAVFGDYLRFVRTDSVAELRPENAIGDFVIEIADGTLGAGPLAGGGTIRFRRALTLNDVAGELQSRFAGGVAEFKRLTAEIPEVMAELHATLENSRKLTGQLVEMESRLDARMQSLGQGLERTVDSFNGEIVPSLARSSRAAEGLLARSSETMTTVSARLPGLLERADRALEQAEAVSADLRRSSGALPGLLQETGILVRDSQALVDSTQRVWPIRRYVTPLQDKRRTVDGYE